MLVQSLAIAPCLTDNIFKFYDSPVVEDFVHCFTITKNSTSFLQTTHTRTQCHIIQTHRSFVGYCIQAVRHEIVQAITLTSHISIGAETTDIRMDNSFTYTMTVHVITTLAHGFAGYLHADMIAIR